MDDENVCKTGREELTECDDSCDTCEEQVTSTCHSCGMPMNITGDFGGGVGESSYCANCSNPDGALKSYDEIYVGIILMYINKRGMERQEAERVARDYMAMMPAWADYKPEKIQ